MYKITVKTVKEYNSVISKADRNGIKKDIDFFDPGTAVIKLECTKREWKKLK